MLRKKQSRVGHGMVAGSTLARTGAGVGRFGGCSPMVAVRFRSPKEAASYPGNRLTGSLSTATVTMILREAVFGLCRYRAARRRWYWTGNFTLIIGICQTGASTSQGSGK